MHLVEEYLRRARTALAEAERATALTVRDELRRLSVQWESLARSRLELLGLELARDLPIEGER